MRGRGYSIIELTIVIIIVGILAVAMALQMRSREMHKLRAAAENPLQGSDTPDNPWCSQTAHCSAAGLADDVSAGTAASRGTGVGAFGWRYDATSGLIYANSAVNGGTAGTSTENNF